VGVIEFKKGYSKDSHLERHPVSTRGNKPDMKQDEGGFQ